MLLWEPPHLDHSLVKGYPLGPFSIWSAHVAAAPSSWYMVVSKSQRPQKWKKLCRYNIFKKRFFTITFKNGKMEALFAPAWDQKLPAQSQINLHVLCVCMFVTRGWHKEIIYKLLIPQKSIMWRCCSSEPIFEAPWRYNDAAPTDLSRYRRPS